MFGRRKKMKMKTDQDYQDANDAWLKSVQDREELAELRGAVENTVRGHLQLQRDNHFAERLAAAYRGEFA